MRHHTLQLSLTSPWIAHPHAQDLAAMRALLDAQPALRVERRASLSRLRAHGGPRRECAPPRPRANPVARAIDLATPCARSFGIARPVRPPDRRVTSHARVTTTHRRALALFVRASVLLANSTRRGTRAR